MRVYVLGAGVSNSVGYPLASSLIEEIDRFIRSSPKCFNRFDYQKKWPDARNWCEHHCNPIIREAYRTGNLEHIFTVLDQMHLLYLDRISANAGQTQEEKSAESHREFEAEARIHDEKRRIILLALADYLEYRHHYDCEDAVGNRWNILRSFGEKLRANDVVITFNYDSTIERVLHKLGKWSARDGYGFPIDLRAASDFEKPVNYPESQVKVYHLHGAVGWYTLQDVKRLREEPKAAISLDPCFLADLGIEAVDSTLTRTPGDQYQVILHPSYFKNYELSGHYGPNDALIETWKRAAAALRKADQIFIIGYSLPPADSAALTLLITCCKPEKMSVINPCKQALARFAELRFTTRVSSPLSFEEWVCDDQRKSS